MTINPMKALAADRVLSKHGLPSKTEDQPQREYMSKEDAEAEIMRLSVTQEYRSKIDQNNRRNWHV